jgi:O-antigen ligase
VVELEMSFNKKIACFAEKTFSGFFFILYMFILLPITATQLYKKILLFSFVFLMFTPIIYFIRPDRFNYSAYYMIILTFSVIFFLFKEDEFKVDGIIIFFVWYIINGIFVRGISNIHPSYYLFIVPLTSLSLYIFFTSQGNEYKYDTTIFFLKCLILSITLESILGISQSFFSFPIFTGVIQNAFISDRNYLAYIFPSISPFVTQGTGTFESPNGLGALLSLVFPLIFGFWYSNRKNFLRILLLVISFLGLLTSYSRGALIGVLFTSLFFPLFLSRLSIRKKIVIFSFIIIFFIVFLSNYVENYYLATQNLTIRIKIWDIVWNYATKDPLRLILGYGIFFFRDNILGFEGIPKDIHSGQLEILMELGIVGFVIFCSYYFKMIFQALKFRNNILILSIAAGLMSFFVHQLVENSFFGYAGILMACLMGILKFLINNNNVDVLEWWYGSRYDNKE